MKNRGNWNFISLIIFLLILFSLSPLISAQKYSVNVTTEHPFLLANGTYVQAKDLQLGMQLKTIEGKIAIITNKSSHHSDIPFPVYNLEADPYNNFILPGGVIVHNSENPASQEFLKNNADFLSKIKELASNSESTSVSPETSKAIINELNKIQLPDLTVSSERTQELDNILLSDDKDSIKKLSPTDRIYIAENLYGRKLSDIEKKAILAMHETEICSSDYKRIASKTRIYESVYDIKDANQKSFLENLMTMKVTDSSPDSGDVGKVETEFAQREIPFFIKGSVSTDIEMQLEEIKDSFNKLFEESNEWAISYINGEISQEDFLNLFTENSGLKMTNIRSFNIAKTGLKAGKVTIEVTDFPNVDSSKEMMNIEIVYTNMENGQITDNLRPNTVSLVLYDTTQTPIKIKKQADEKYINCFKPKSQKKEIPRNPLDPSKPNLAQIILDSRKKLSDKELLQLALKMGYKSEQAKGSHIRIINNEGVWITDIAMGHSKDYNPIIAEQVIKRLATNTPDFHN